MYCTYRKVRFERTSIEKQFLQWVNLSVYDAHVHPLYKVWRMFGKMI